LAALVHHVEGEARDRGVARHINLVAELPVLEQLRVLAEIDEAGDEGVAPLDPAAEAGHDHDGLRVEQRREVAGPALQPRAVDPLQGRGDRVPACLVAHP
jgi:hypothetical protein